MIDKNYDLCITIGINYIHDFARSCGVLASYKSSKKIEFATISLSKTNLYGCSATIAIVDEEQRRYEKNEKFIPKYVINDTKLGIFDKNFHLKRMMTQLNIGMMLCCCNDVDYISRALAQKGVDIILKYCDMIITPNIELSITKELIYGDYCITTAQNNTNYKQNEKCSYVLKIAEYLYYKNNIDFETSMALLTPVVIQILDVDNLQNANSIEQKIRVAINSCDLRNLAFNDKDIKKIFSTIDWKDFEKWFKNPVEKNKMMQIKQCIGKEFNNDL